MENSISLDTLKIEYGFTPPQSYAYDDRYPELTRAIEQSLKIKR